MVNTLYFDKKVIKDFRNAYDIYKNEITLPLHTLLTDEDVNYVISSFKDCLKAISD